jgi:hypothetical protein
MGMRMGMEGCSAVQCSAVQCSARREGAKGMAHTCGEREHASAGASSRCCGNSSGSRQSLGITQRRAGRRGVAARTVAAAVARLPGAVDHVLLAEQQLLAGGAVPGGLEGTHRAEGLRWAGQGGRRVGGRYTRVGG